MTSVCMLIDFSVREEVKMTEYLTRSLDWKNLMRIGVIILKFNFLFFSIIQYLNSSWSVFSFSFSFLLTIVMFICCSELTFLAGVAVVTRFTDTGAMATVTLKSVLLDTATLLGAARSKGPLRTSWRRKLRMWRKMSFYYTDMWGTSLTFQCSECVQSVLVGCREQ